MTSINFFGDRGQMPRSGFLPGPVAPLECCFAVQRQHVLHAVDEVLTDFGHAPHLFRARASNRAWRGPLESSRTRRFQRPAAPGLLGQEPQGPSCAPLWRRTADHRDDRGLLTAIELRRWLWSRVFSQCLLQTTAQVPLPDPRNLPRVPIDRGRRRAHGLPGIEKQQHLNPSPHPCC